jgi:nucleotide-binding universal stress UspA family protein
MMICWLFMTNPLTSACDQPGRSTGPATVPNGRGHRAFRPFPVAGRRNRVDLPHPDERTSAMFSNRPPVVVGVDDTPASDRALWWAVEEAHRRRVPLRVVHAYSWPPTVAMAPTMLTIPRYAWREAADTAQRRVADLVERARGWAPSVPVEGVAVQGNAVQVLRSESRWSVAVVLGSRQLHAFGSFFLGSVGQGVAERGHCPVIVIRGPSAEPADGARVIAGVGPGTDSPEVLEYAFEAAGLRNLPLEAVVCWHPSPMDSTSLVDRYVARAREQVVTALAETLQPWREKFPDVPVISRVLADRPVPGLVAQATGQHLLVVGATGHHAVAGALLGFVSHGVLHHAPCPVAVVPTIKKEDRHEQ